MGEVGSLDQSLQKLRLNWEQLEKISKNSSQISERSKETAKLASQINKEFARKKSKWRHHIEVIANLRNSIREVIESDLRKARIRLDTIKTKKPEHYKRMISVPIDLAKEECQEWLKAVGEAIDYQQKKRRKNEMKLFQRVQFCQREIQRIQKTLEELKDLDERIRNTSIHETPQLSFFLDDEPELQLQFDKKEKTKNSRTAYH